MKKFLFSVIGTQGGDLNPLIGIARELISRGHHVTLASNEYHQPKIERLGIDYLRLRATLNQKEIGTWFEYAAQSRLKGNEYLMRDCVIPWVEWNYRQLAKSVPAYDVLLNHSLVFPTPLVAEKLGRPWASFVLQPLAFFSQYDSSLIIGHSSRSNSMWRLPLAPWLVRVLRSLGAKKTNRWLRPVAELRESLALTDRGKVHPLLEGQYSPHLNLALFSRIFAREQQDWPQPFAQTGFVFHDQEGESLSPEARAFLAKGDPPIAFSLGSIGGETPLGERFYKAALDAARLLNKRALLIVGGSGKNASDLPKDERLLISGYEPFSQLSSRISTLVHNGGMGSISYGLYAGIPQLSIPFSYEQCDNALRLQDLGVSKTIPIAKLNSSILCERLTQLAQRTHGERALEIQDQIAGEHGATAAADHLEAL